MKVILTEDVKSLGKKGEIVRGKRRLRKKLYFKEEKGPGSQFQESE